MEELLRSQVRRHEITGAVVEGEGDLNCRQRIIELSEALGLYQYAAVCRSKKGLPQTLRIARPVPTRNFPSYKGTIVSIEVCKEEICDTR